MRPVFETTHLPDLQGPVGARPPRSRRLRRFYGDLVRFASFGGFWHARRTPVRCRKRPGRKPCGGLLVVRREERSVAVEWECPVCGGGGYITGWEGTGDDLRHLVLDGSEDLWRVPISVAAHAVLRDLAWSSGRLTPIVYRCEVDDAGQPLLLVTPIESVRAIPALQARTDGLRASRLDRLFEVVDALSMVAVKVPSAVREAEIGPGRSALIGVLAQVLGAEPEDAPVVSPQRVPGRRRSAVRQRSARTTHCIRVTLRDVRPPVWRRLFVPSDISLPKLHEVLQRAMGWRDRHPHRFRVRDRIFTLPGDYEPIGEDSRDFTLRDLAHRGGCRLVYEYDFGDGWCLGILVEHVLEGRCPSPCCVAGRRRCPPEDCGGPWGYAELREALTDPGHERHAEIVEWIGDGFDPDEFDLSYTDAVVQDVAV